MFAGPDLAAIYEQFPGYFHFYKILRANGKVQPVDPNYTGCRITELYAEGQSFKGKRDITSDVDVSGILPCIGLPKASCRPAVHALPVFVFKVSWC